MTITVVSNAIENITQPVNIFLEHYSSKLLEDQLLLQVLTYHIWFPVSV